MSGLAQHQNVFRIAKREATNNGTHSVSTKRKRSSPSCLPCKARKLKCDRQLPCVSCSKRGDNRSCIYSDAEKSGREKRECGHRDSEARLRLQRLEEMVTGLIQTDKECSENRSDKTPPRNGTDDQKLDEASIHSSPQISEQFSRGGPYMEGSTRGYVSATHWTTILENIRDIQDVLEHEPDRSEDIPSSESSNEPDIILGTTQTLTLADVCASLPPRPMVDRLLSVFFNTMHSQIPVLHTGKFLREYESFWTEPTSVSFLWISMLFSTLYIGSRNEQASNEQVVHSSQSPQRTTFFKRAGQALMTGNYMKTKPYTVESVLLYGMCKYLQKDEHDTDAWMTIGISTRLAMKMGYHRDPRYLANISPFEGEMRRRTFFILEAFDLLLSFQAGLPAMIQEEDCDTDPPGNLFDTDFDEECKALPPSRPPTDPTPMLYYRYKSRLARLFRRVYQHATSFKPSSYEETMKLDAELDRAHKDVPPSLRLKPLALSFTDQPYMNLNRLYAKLVYLKSVCVLHRKYLSQNRSDPSFDYSRRACGDAALQILKYQAELNQACQSGGLFYDHRWMLSSLSSHDFLLAAMITSLDLYESHKQSATLVPENLEAQVEKYDCLRDSNSIWMSQKEISRDAWRALSILAIMLSKVPRPKLITKAPQGMSRTTDTPINGHNRLEVPVRDLGNSSCDKNAFNLADQQSSINNYNLADFSATDPLNTVFSEPNDIDWGLIDQSLLGLSGDIHVPPNWQLLDGYQVPPGI